MDRAFLDDFRDDLDASAARLLTLSDAQASVRPAPGKWSPKEIIGHLIDSASNNHGRFVRAQLQDDLIFDGYEQDDWVAVSAIRNGTGEDLVRLWVSFNLHIVAPDGNGRFGRADESTASAQPRCAGVARQELGNRPPSSTFMRDYVGHLKHHLRQVPTSHHG